MHNLKRVANLCSFFWKLILAQIIAPLFKLCSRKYRHVWIIAERGDDARDNGYFFYKYLKTKHPEINSWYIINNNSSDCPKIRNLGNQINYASFRHFLFYVLSEVRICSSSWGGDLPNAYYFLKLKKYKEKRKVVFLQHGITKDYLPNLLAEKNPVDLFICGAKPEFEYVRNFFHYRDGVVKYTGLARFDNLHNVQTKSQILIMPTFRRWLQGKEMSCVEDSEYVKKWNEVLNNQQLVYMLEENDLNVVFYPHYVMQSYIKVFNTNSEKVKIAAFKDYDVQELLIESQLLITDYSSVFFDFAYMEKPIIYYQFDRADYISRHYDYTSGYFDYDLMGFGPVVFEIEDFIDTIKRFIDNGCRMEQSQLERVDSFFPIRDAHNSERILDAIQQMIQE